jgi:hypothetical protein
MIGEFLNSGAAHVQYGYFTSVAGLNSVQAKYKKIATKR